MTNKTAANKLLKPQIEKNNNEGLLINKHVWDKLKATINRNVCYYIRNHIEMILYSPLRQPLLWQYVIFAKSIAIASEWPIAL